MMQNRTRFGAVSGYVFGAVGGLTLLFAALPADAAGIATGFESCDVFKEARKWDGVETAAKQRLAIVRQPVRSGRCALSMTLQPGDRAGGKKKRNRLELRATVPAKPGSEEVYRFSLFVPERYPATPRCGVIVAQWKPGGPAGPTVALKLGKQAGRIGFHMTAGVKGRNVGPVTTFQAKSGRWNDFAVRVRWSQGRDGLVELTHNGEVRGRKSGANRAGRKPYRFKVGQYAGKCTVAARSRLIFDDVMAR